jgi:predicted nucleic acid-binding Zn finger protein
VGKRYVATNIDVYTVLPKLYCSCQSFQFSVIARSEAPLCKHQLAARLADAMGCTRSEVVEDEVIYELLVGECYVLV